MLEFPKRPAGWEARKVSGQSEQGHLTERPGLRLLDLSCRVHQPPALLSLDASTHDLKRWVRVSTACTRSSPPNRRHKELLELFTREPKKAVQTEGPAIAVFT